MGRIVRQNGMAYEVVDEGRGIVREARLGASVVSEMETQLPWVLDISLRFVIWLQMFLLKLIMGLRDKLAGKGKLEELHIVDASKKIRSNQSGLIGGFVTSLLISIETIRISAQFIIYLGIKIVGILRKKESADNSLPVDENMSE